MAVGPGKYDEECNYVREKTGAHLAIVVVIGGDRGPGFAVQTYNDEILFNVPKILHEMADEIENSK
jgi:hypothetical protein